MDNEERFFYEYIVISKAIGDFIAFESFLTDKEKINLKEIIFFVNKRNTNETRFNIIKNNIFYNKKLKITLITPKLNTKNLSFRDERSSLIEEHVLNNLYLSNYKHKILIDYKFHNQDDQYKKIVKNQNIKNYSFIKQKLCEINKFKLPQEYISISAWTNGNAKKKDYLKLKIGMKQ